MAKQPIAAVGTNKRKQPMEPAFDRDEVMQRRPVWRFGAADHDGTWAFDCLTGDALIDVLKKLGDFESMTVRELFHRGEEPGKHYKVSGLPAAARVRLTELERDDETEISRLRLTGTQRLYGFLREHVFHVLWWDPDHTVYPSNKKHT